MKRWRVDFSIRYADGTIKEHDEFMVGETIGDVVNAANEMIKIPMERMNEIDDVVIWGIGIITETDEPAEVF